MKVTIDPFNNEKLRLKVQLWENDPAKKFLEIEPPLRSELYNADQMEQRGKTLAHFHILRSKGSSDPKLLKRLDENEEILLEVQFLVSEALKAKRQITPAGEWILDNFYLIEEQIRTGKKHLPKGYIKELPLLENGPQAGYPRVYDIALEIISHGDGRVDEESLSRFVSAYQNVTPLKLGELWAIPIMLRLALIENLRRVASRVASGRIDRNLADSWADQLTDTAEKNPKNLILVMADMARSNPPLSSPFISELVRRLQGQSPSLAFPLTWLEQRLAETNQTFVQVIQIENQQQAANQVSISNSIGSLRFLGALDWHKFVESISIVEQTMRFDPANQYEKMDFATRDLYRHIIENLSRYSNISETDTAQKALHLARKSAIQYGNDDRKAHIGYYLLGKGQWDLKKEINASFSFEGLVHNVYFRIPPFIYVFSIVLMSVFLAGGLYHQAQFQGLSGWIRWPVFIILLFCSSHLAVAIVNWISTLIIPPKPIPRMDFSKGISKGSETLVVVPTMISNTTTIDSLIENMEVRFLANQDKQLRFGLLTDFNDADSEWLPEDELLMNYGREKIDALNLKYKPYNDDIFFLFHRKRLWNPKEGKWMGYERKRGKLAELNILLRGGASRFYLIVGNINVLQHTMYVITLDTDTQLPRDSARQFAGAMAHPLNKPYYHPAKKRITEGYAILQPRVAVSLPGTNRSRYARMCGNEPGIDPYTRAISDVYQDLFGEGSFIGKGIYDVDAFEKTLAGRFRENRILSHDLLEGCHARSGMISDVLLFEDYPAGYMSDVNRRHRWMRGDWQILQWIFPVIRDVSGKLVKNPISFLSKWKIFDNLRRSIVPIAFILLLIIGWCYLDFPIYWTLVVIFLITIPLFIVILIDFAEKPEDVPMNQHLPVVTKLAFRHLAQSAFYFITLPYEAFYSFDAILRTLWRLFISRRHLLEWNPSHATEMVDYKTIHGIYKIMWFAPFMALGILMDLIFTNHFVLLFVWPIILIWIFSPLMAWSISVPLVPKVVVLSLSQRSFLGELARKTWAFFEIYVNQEENFLPPDNFQEHPVGIIAHRTSPTNIGLSLLANLTAFDFGFLPVKPLLQRLSDTFKTMSVLDRFQGHFYNWYDTQYLKPLRPLYISSVDSGNLVGHLLTLRSGLNLLPDEPIISVRTFQGLGDTLRVLAIETRGPLRTRLVPFQKELSQASIDPHLTLRMAYLYLEDLLEASVHLKKSFGDESNSQISYWTQTLEKQCLALLDNLMFFTPWVMLPVIPDRLTYFPNIDKIPTLRQLANLETSIEKAIQSWHEENPDIKSSDDEITIFKLIKETSKRAKEQLERIENLMGQAKDFSTLEYDFLYDRDRHMQSIGYNAEEHRRDSSNYDLLASEARLSTFVGIATGQLPQESWFALGRLLTTTTGEPILLSWSGSMFEYLMPLLVMPNYENTILDQTYKAAVRIQIDYGKKRGIPWGISESGYNTVDVNQNYQYRAFGVPGLGLKRGLSEDLVIAPYATVMALMVMPEEACQNLQRLTADGYEGNLGFYEAIDYTPIRVPRGQTNAIIRSYMAHHQGMSFLSLAYLLLDKPMQKRFEADPQFQATLLLLQERIPRATSFYSHTIGLTDIQPGLGASELSARVLKTPHTPAPEVHLLSNGNYHVMVTNAGGGYSRWRNYAMTRWHEDSTTDHWGTFLYLRDRETNEYWSTAYQPTLVPSERYEAIFSKGKAEFRLSYSDIDTHTEIVVSPEDDIELRRVRITNRSKLKRQLDLTSYSEIVIANPAADAMHPAFSNLFVQTEILPQRQSILCTRRPRSEDDQTPFMFHMMTMHTQTKDDIFFETDRMKFVGRGNTPANPSAMNKNTKLSNSEGSVLDPIAAIQYQITINPEESITIDCISGMAETREMTLSLIDKYHDRWIANRVFELAWTHSQVVLRQINASEMEAQLYARLASSVIYSNASLRADASVLIRNRKGQSGLWGYAISGDIPIVLLQIEDTANINLVRQLVQAHAYWRLKGLAVDLIIWNEDHAGYRQLLQDQILGLITSSIEANNLDRQGGIFVRAADQISSEDRILIQTVARAIISDTRGDLTSQINRRGFGELLIPRLKTTQPYRQQTGITDTIHHNNDLVFHNGYGGFTPDGKEFVMTTNKNHVTPAPWVNVIANQGFGTVISESGSAYTWSENAHEFRLTPWNNDPVSDVSGEVIYLRDEENGHFWTPTPLPARGISPYNTRHGLGYCVFEHTETGIYSELWVYVALDAPIKFSVLKIKNQSGRPRKISVTGYVDWVLGDLRSKSALHIVTEVDQQTMAIYARNPYNSEFNNHVAFFMCDERSQTFTCDRTEFYGRNGSLKKPAALFRANLSGKKGVAMDPCTAIQTVFELSDQQEKEIIFKLGAGKDSQEASSVVRRFIGSAQAQKALEAIWKYWNRTLNAVQIETPDPSINILTNSWLIYQTLACRVWARSGFYQSGGAYGFRDQLQDTMALIHTEPQIMRNFLLLYASRQFVEGDVQHWWHPPTGRGVRTHCSDDFLWLPLAVIRYVQTTGDTGVLNEKIRFLSDRPVNPDDDSYYDLPNLSDESASLYEHCVRAVKRGLTSGEHSLPLIGTCDWNDGMNLVGNHGKGESVWLAFFLYDILRQFSKIAIIQHDQVFEDHCLQESALLRQRIEQNAWDGEWYRRGYFDDGTPLGSSSNDECQIDSISQSWSVLSGAGDSDRTKKAMNSVDKRLIKRDFSLIQLLDPPFDKSKLNPGYIKGYVPGVRENGGQYTHAAIWVAMAFAKGGDSKRTWETLSLINPINHSNTHANADVYKVEPYVMAADVYAVAPHIGRGGWTWYTGSAGWMYRLITESVLGLRREVDKLYVEPCIPEHWDTFTIRYRYWETFYHIHVFQSDNVKIYQVMDGVSKAETYINLVDDRVDHHVEFNIPRMTK